VGKISYGIYLLHVFLFAVLKKNNFYTTAVTSGNVPKLLVFMVVEFLTVIAIAAASFYGFERHITALKRYFRTPTVSARQFEEVRGTEADLLIER
jgi:peptidoglycan/LPS O-acetylase OafA/YrhL